jgi:predicted lysophospholipase L1 biosynthesis ABC-type transport system permease subunit
MLVGSAQITIAAITEGASMEGLLLLVGRIAAVAGVAACAWAIVSRFMGLYYTSGFQIGTLLMGGMAAMLLACVCFLVVLTNRSRR